MPDHRRTAAMRLRGRGPLVLLPLLGVNGCLGDPPPDPSVAPIEVVVDSSQAAERCVLNRKSVAAGTHEVLLLTEGGPATIRILSESGDVVFTGRAVPGEGEAGPHGSASVQLSEGAHTVECTPDGASPLTVPLQVDP